MKKITVLLALTFLGAFVVPGCSREDDDAASIKAWIKADTVWFNANTTVDTTKTDSTAYILMMPDSTKGILWWRGPQTHDTAIVDIKIVGDSAWVEWSRTNIGKLGILALVARDSATDTLVYWEKDVYETTKLRGIFRKTNEDTAFDGWILEKVSCAVGSSDNGTVRIDSIHIASSEYGEWINDPLSRFYDLDSLVTFHSQEDVTVTLYANDPETEAFLHTFILFWPYYVRAEFPDMGGGVHEGTWKAQAIPFPRFAIFDLMSQSTIWGSQVTYNFYGVLFPYNIKWP